jgi:hypothetical protein
LRTTTFSKLPTVIILSVLLIAGLSGKSWAQENKPYCGGPELSLSDPGFFEKRIACAKWSMGLEGGYAIKLWGRNNFDMFQVLPSVTFPISGPKGRSWWRGVWEYKMEGVFGFMVNHDNRIEAGFSPLGVKYNFIGDGRFVPYTELLMGAVYLDAPRNRQGSHFNFIESFTVGTQYFVTKDLAMLVSVRFRHLSDAGIDEPNQGFNSGHLMFGVTYYR